MSLLYADTSALVRAYVVDEPDHDALRLRVLEGAEAVITSELTRVELASAVTAAARAGRVGAPQLILDRFDADCGDEGPLTLLRLDPDATLPVAYKLVREHRLRTLDAVHLAVALTDGRALAAGDSLVVVTRDDAQTEAARERGLDVA